MSSVAIDTISGRVTGTTLEGVGTPVRRYLGIAYGAPPIGPMRFQAPVAAKPWTGIRECVEFGNSAIQPSGAMSSFGHPEDEDCLGLNVWAPVDAERAPVMVWFHGGGFTTGSGAIPWYDGTRLARRGVIVVTVNYRLGPLGFLNVGDGGERFGCAANAGLLDQALALRWVQESIGGFGGDPANVTIFGESAGAMSVSLHLGMTESAGRFRRVIAQSGASGHAQTPEHSCEVGRQVLEFVGVDAGQLDRLFDVPARAFADLQSTVTVPGALLPLAFAPTIDGDVIPADVTALLRDGASSGVDLLCGTTLDEMRLFTAFDGATEPLTTERVVRRVDRALSARQRHGNGSDVVELYRSARPQSSPNQIWVAIATDLVFRVPCHQMAAAHRSHGETRLYRYDHPSTAFGGTIGAAHAMEIPFVFDNLDATGVEMLEGEITPSRRQLAGQLADAWVAFAATGDPGSALGEAWPVIGSNRSTMCIDLVSSVEDDPSGDELAVWVE